MELHYDAEVDILAIRLAPGPCAESEEVESGIVLDFDGRGTVIGVEILDAVRRSKGQPFPNFHVDAATLSRDLD